MQFHIGPGKPTPLLASPAILPPHFALEPEATLSQMWHLGTFSFIPHCSGASHPFSISVPLSWCKQLLFVFPAWRVGSPAHHARFCLFSPRLSAPPSHLPPTVPSVSILSSYPCSAERLSAYNSPVRMEEKARCLGNNTYSHQHRGFTFDRFRIHL